MEEHPEVTNKPRSEKGVVSICDQEILEKKF